MAEGKIITGYVYDAMGDPIVSATILLEGTQIGTATDINGYYTLRLQPAPALTARLICSSVGFKTQYVVIGNETYIEFYLEEDMGGADSDPGSDPGYDPGSDPSPKIFGTISNILLNGESATEVWLNGIQIWPPETDVVLYCESGSYDVSNPPSQATGVLVQWAIYYEDLSAGSQTTISTSDPGIFEGDVQFGEWGVDYNGFMWHVPEELWGQTITLNYYLILRFFANNKNNVISEKSKYGSFNYTVPGSPIETFISPPSITL